MNEASKPIQYIKYKDNHVVQKHGHVIIEKPISLTVNGSVWLDFMCTPTNLDALALGFLFNEGVIDSLNDVVSVTVWDNKDNIDVLLQEDVEKPDHWRRTSGCTGGLTSVENLEDQAGNGIISRSSDYSLSVENIFILIRLLIKSQEIYQISGGVHSSALCDRHDIHAKAEDIGRHNTLDKISGLCLLNDIALNQRILLTTGRISSEMLQKAARIGASFVISRTSPSSLSIQLADMWGITLIGYARRDQFRVYTYGDRILT